MEGDVGVGVGLNFCYVLEETVAQDGGHSCTKVGVLVEDG